MELSLASRPQDGLWYPGAPDPEGEVAELNPESWCYYLLRNARYELPVSRSVRQKLGLIPTDGPLARAQA